MDPQKETDIFYVLLSPEIIEYVASNKEYKTTVDEKVNKEIMTNIGMIENQFDSKHETSVQ